MNKIINKYSQKTRRICWCRVQQRMLYYAESITYKVYSI